jgi:hypothetical protein
VTTAPGSTPRFEADAGGGARVIAGEDLDADASAVETGQRLGGGGGQGVTQADEADEGQRALVGAGVWAEAGGTFG